MSGLNSDENLSYFSDSCGGAQLGRLSPLLVETASSMKYSHSCGSNKFGFI